MSCPRRAVYMEMGTVCRKTGQWRDTNNDETIGYIADHIWHFISIIALQDILVNKPNTLCTVAKWLILWYQTTFNTIFFSAGVYCVRVGFITHICSFARWWFRINGTCAERCVQILVHHTHTRIYTQTPHTYTQNRMWCICVRDQRARCVDNFFHTRTHTHTDHLTHTLYNNTMQCATRVVGRKRKGSPIR